MDIQDWKLEQLHPYENNPRNNDDAVGPVANSIKQFGFKVPIVVTTDGEIINGHTRYKAAKRLKLETVPVIIADDLSDEQIKAFRLADNKTGELADWNMDKLMEELEGLSNLDDIDMTDFGFDDIQIEESQLDEPEDDDYDVTPVEDPISKLGQIWKLGNHRLMVGDSTNATQVAKLLDGNLADMLLTDPPYNVALGATDSASQSEARDRHRRTDGLTIANDDMPDEEFHEFLKKAFLAGQQNLKPGGTFYIWYADTESLNFRGAAKEIGLQVRENLIWVKNTFTLGRQDFQWRHEPCLYGWNEGASHNWYSDRKQSTILEFDKPMRSDMHPTMKPIPLFAYQIGVSSQIGDSVLDLFGGSGTTVIAAEQTKRKAYVMELDPRYADVIINRWEEYTGEQAELLTE